MKEKILVLLMLVIVSCFVFGCSQANNLSSSSGSSSSSSTNYFPHSNGNSWIYSGSSSPAVLGTWESTYLFGGTTTLHFNNAYISTQYLSSQNASWFDRSGYFVEDNTGVYKYGGIGGPTNEAEVLISYPLQVGKKWESYSGFTREVIAQETITVPAGTFNAIKIKKNPAGSPVYEWYADGVGLIKEYTEYGTSKLITELKSKNF